MILPNYCKLIFGIWGPFFKIWLRKNKQQSKIIKAMMLAFKGEIELSKDIPQWENVLLCYGIES